MLYYAFSPKLAKYVHTMEAIDLSLRAPYFYPPQLRGRMKKKREKTMTNELQLVSKDMKLNYNYTITMPFLAEVAIIGIICLFIIGCIPKKMDTLPVVPVSSSNTYGTSIDIRVPDMLENGAVTPFSANFSPPLKSGDLALVLLAEDRLAYSVEIEGNAKVSQLSGRIKNRFGNMLVIVKRDGTVIGKKTVALNGNIYNQLSDGASEKTNCKAKGQENQVKILCMNDMTSTGYIDNIDISLPGGNIRVSLTPNASKKPYIGLVGGFNGSAAKVHPSIAAVPFIDNSYLTTPSSIDKKEGHLPTGSSKKHLITYTCSDLSKRDAYNLLSQGHSYLDKDGDGHPCEWKPKPSYTPRRSSNCHWVSGYYRKGRYVKRHRRCR